jgi:hypothetical protein
MWIALSSLAVEAQMCIASTSRAAPMGDAAPPGTFCSIQSCADISSSSRAAWVAVS